MSFIPPETIERARQMDLLTYLRTFEPNELVHIGSNHYCTREHKRFSFSIPAQNSDSLHLFESAIDLLSFATLVKQNGGNWQRDHLVSLAGVYKPKENLQESSLPLTLTRYLSEYPNIKWINLRLDNDKAGGYMAKALVALLSDKYEVSVQPPPCGKDYNDYLCMKLGIPITHRKSKAQER